MIISEMRESSASQNKTVDQALDTADAPRRTLLRYAQEQTRNVWLVMVGTLMLSFQGAQLTYQQLKTKLKRDKSITEDEDTPFIGITDSEEELLGEELSQKEKKRYVGPNVFERLMMKGALSEGPLIREEYGTTHEMGEKNSLIILTTRAYINTRRLFKGIGISAKTEMDGYLQEAIKQGEIGEETRSRKWKDINENFDQKVAEAIKGLKPKPMTGTWSNPMRGMRKKLWNGLGLADKAEIELLRNEIGRLTETLRHTTGKRVLQPMPPISMITTHDRRHEERRREHLTVAYERRSLQRRA